MPDEQPKAPDAVTLTIDGHSVTVPRDTLVVEAAKQVQIEVPVFCYHHKLDPVGACRLCLVEIAPGPPKPTTACTTPVAEGMVVKTNSAMASGARADILEYELVNHPLDCPVCDKGGECPLQDYTFRHGYPTSRIDAPRLHFKKPIPLSERIALDRERCVLCYRCTRYYDEIAWEQELTSDQRGVHTFITSQFDRPLESIFSGNIIDLCPVGALTSRVWRFESRPWDMDHTFSVCSQCSVGCNVTLWQRRNELVRVTSHENDEIDDGWICDRGRFEYTHVNSPDRVRTPRVGGRPATWPEAMDALEAGLRGRKQPGIRIPQDITLEEAYLVRRLLDGPWKGARVAMERRTLLPAPDVATLAIKEIEAARTVVVIASDTADDVPIVNLRIKKAVSKRGARLLIVHPGELDLDRWPRGVEHVRPEAGGTAEAVRKLRRHAWLESGPIAILYGDGHGSEDVTALAAAVSELAESCGGAVMPLYRGTNERGALAVGLAGSVETLDGCDAVLLWGPGPAPDSAQFVAVWDSLVRPGHGEPDVLLPDVSFAETQGSYMNLEGRVQFLRPALQVPPPLREGWEVLAELAQRAGLEADYLGIFQLQKEAAAAHAALAPLADPPAPTPRPTPVMYGPARP
ncbi:MAG TPA: 2Fe-2S iron-sulfur cluster-binding protein [Candidatus Dormibacteraeota bacterium]